MNSDFEHMAREDRDLLLGWRVPDVQPVEAEVGMRLMFANGMLAQQLLGASRGMRAVTLGCLAGLYASIGVAHDFAAAEGLILVERCGEIIVPDDLSGLTGYL